MDGGWRTRERRGIAAERRVLLVLCAVFGALAVGGFMLASLAVLVVGAVGATLAIGLIQHLSVAERLLSRE